VTIHPNPKDLQTRVVLLNVKKRNWLAPSVDFPRKGAVALHYFIPSSFVGASTLKRSLQVSPTNKHPVGPETPSRQGRLLAGGLRSCK